MATLSNSGKAQAELVMTGDSKGSRRFFSIKKKEAEEGTWELSFVDSLFTMHRLREKIHRIQSDIRAHQSVQQYTHNFGEFIFYKSMNFKSSYLEHLAKDKNNALNAEARTKAAEYYLEALILQYNTLLLNCEKTYMELINYHLFVDFIVPLFEKLSTNI